MGVEGTYTDLAVMQLHDVQETRGVKRRLVS
jgi:hypothetical protein